MQDKETIKARLIQIQNYLDRNWNGLSDNFVERLLAIGEYDKLTKELQNGNFRRN